MSPRRRGQGRLVCPEQCGGAAPLCLLSCTQPLGASGEVEAAEPARGPRRARAGSPQDAQPGPSPCAQEGAPLGSARKSSFRVG